MCVERVEQGTQNAALRGSYVQGDGVGGELAHFHHLWSAGEEVLNNNAAVVSKHCSPLVEFMFVKCRPFYLPREFTAIVIGAVYIPPCANANDALRELYSAISEQQTNNPDGFFIIAGYTTEKNAYKYGSKIMTIVFETKSMLNSTNRKKNALQLTVLVF